MPLKSKTPAHRERAEASRDLLGGWSQSLPTVDALRVQTLILAHAVRPELAAMLATLAFGGQHNG